MAIIIDPDLWLNTDEALLNVNNMNERENVNRSRPKNRRLDREG